MASIRQKKNCPTLLPQSIECSDFKIVSPKRLLIEDLFEYQKHGVISLDTGNFSSGSGFIVSIHCKYIDGIDDIIFTSDAYWSKYTIDEQYTLLIENPVEKMFGVLMLIDKLGKVHKITRIFNSDSIRIYNNSCYVFIEFKNSIISSGNRYADIYVIIDKSDRGSAHACHFPVNSQPIFKFQSHTYGSTSVELINNRITINSKFWDAIGNECIVKAKVNNGRFYCEYTKMNEELRHYMKCGYVYKMKEFRP